MNIDPKYANLVGNVMGNIRIGDYGSSMQKYQYGAWRATSPDGLEIVKDSSRNRVENIAGKVAVVHTTKITIRDIPTNSNSLTGGRYRLEETLLDNYYRKDRSKAGDGQPDYITTELTSSLRSKGYSEVAWPTEDGFVYFDVIRVDPTNPELTYENKDSKTVLSMGSFPDSEDGYGHVIKNSGYRMTASIRENNALDVLTLTGNDGNNSTNYTLAFKDGVKESDIIKLIRDLPNHEITVDITITNPYKKNENGGTFIREYTKKIPIKGNFSVKYYLNDGTAAEYTGGSDLKTFAIPSQLSNLSSFELKSVPIRKGFMFDGWYTSSEGGVRVTNLLQKQAGDLKLYAHWTASAGLTIADFEKDYVYTGAAVCPEPRVYNAGILMTKNIDYTVKYLNNTVAYEYKDGADLSKRPCVIVTGKGNYSGTRTAYFDILPKDLSDDDVIVSEVANEEYDGKDVTPVPVVSWGKKTLSSANDYQVEYYKKGAQVSENETTGEVTIGAEAVEVTPKDSGVYFIKVTAKNVNYTGSVIRRFEILNEDQSFLEGDCTLSAAAYYYNGGAVCPEPTVRYHGKLLTKDKDYTLNYGKNESVYELRPGDPGYSESNLPYVIIQGQGAYTATTKLCFRIVRKSIEAGDITFSNFDYFYSKSNINPPVPTVTWGNIELVKDTDFTVTYYYRNEKDGVTPISPSNEAEYKVDTNYKAVVSGIGNYRGSRTLEFRLYKDIEADEITLEPASCDYSGNQAKPKVKIVIGTDTLKEGTDYTVSYKNNVNAHSNVNTDGKAPAVIVKGMGAYSSTVEKYFTIEPLSISNDEFAVATITDIYDTGNEYTPLPKVTWGKKTLQKDVDYKIAYYKRGSAGVSVDNGVVNIGADAQPVTPQGIGVYYAVVSGLNNFKGSITRQFTIAESGKKLAAKLSVSAKNKAYTGSPIELGTTELVVKDGKTTLTLNTATDENPNGEYSVTYSNNTEVGTAIVTITGCGEYVGTKVVTFKIIGTDMKKVKINGFVSSFQYEHGRAITQDISKECDTDTCYLGSADNRLKGIPADEYRDAEASEKKNYDFTYEYQNNVNPGKATLILTGVNGYVGEVKKTYSITGSKLIDKLKFVGIPKAESYTGEKICPVFSVENGKYTLNGAERAAYRTLTREEKENVDYKYEYRYNKEIGTAEIIIEGINGYSGKVVKTFKITGIAVSKLSVTGLVSVMDYSGMNLKQKNLTFTYKASKTAAPETIIAKEKHEYNGEPEVGCVYEFVNNRNVGKATMVITGVNRFTGTVNKSFKINPYNITTDAANKISVTFTSGNNEDPAFYYSKSGVCPEVKVMHGETVLTKGKDYKVTYLYNKAVNDKTGRTIPTVKITGIGNFKGDNLSATFKIVRRDISDGSITLTAPNVIYTGKKGAWKAAVTATDSEGKKLAAKTDYAANVVYTYAYVEGTVYDGTSKTPVALTGENARKAGDSVQPNDIVPAGTKIRATISGINNYTGTKDVVYMVKTDISKMAITVNKDSFVYTGEPVTITLDDVNFPDGVKENVEIDLSSYKKNAGAGKASVVIRAKEDSTYSGSKTVTFTIIKSQF